MTEAPAPSLADPLAPAEPRSIAAMLRDLAARPEVREDLRFFLFVYVAGFIAFTSWLA